MKTKQDITIPLELFENKFNLQEIGAICLLLSAPHIQKENLDKWGLDATLAETIKKLTDNRTIVVEKDENGNTITTINTNTEMEEESANMDVRRAIRELEKLHGISGEDLGIIQEYMEELVFSSYTMGYDDGRVDYDDSFTAYGKTEDY